MSQPFTRRLFFMFKFIIKNDFNIDTNKLHILFGKIAVGSLMLVSHGIYAYSTNQYEKINIAKKYEITRNGFTDFMIIDNKKRHFNVTNSFWYNKWDTIEDWYKIKENDELHIKYYGWRIAIFGVFPNIVKCNKNISTL